MSTPVSRLSFCTWMVTAVALAVAVAALPAAADDVVVTATAPASVGWRMSPSDCVITVQAAVATTVTTPCPHSPRVLRLVGLTAPTAVTLDRAQGRLSFQASAGRTLLTIESDPRWPGP